MSNTSSLSPLFESYDPIGWSRDSGHGPGLLSTAWEALITTGNKKEQRDVPYFSLGKPFIVVFRGYLEITPRSTQTTNQATLFDVRILEDMVLLRPYSAEDYQGQT